MDIDSVSGTWSRLFHSKITSPVAMSISWTTPAATTPFFLPPTELMSAFCGL